MTPEDPTSKLTAGAADESAVFAEAARRVVTAVQLSPGEVVGHYERIQARLGGDDRPVVLRGEYAGQRRRDGVFKRQPLQIRIGYGLVGAAIGMIALVAGWRLSTLHLREHQAPVMSTYTTGNGERANITLPDGSTVALDVASRLDVPADYLAGNHTLRLTGEALFSIDHHLGTPLTVIAGPATTQVLGTTFLVRHYATDTMTTVAVRDGKVAVRAGTVPLAVLAAAQQVTLDRTHSTGVQSADPTQFSFATGVLTFKDTPLPQAIADLDRWYNADIQLGDPSLQTRRIMGEYAAGSLVELSNILELTFNVRVVRNQRVLTLFPR